MEIENNLVSENKVTGQKIKLQGTTQTESLVLTLLIKTKTR